MYVKPEGEDADVTNHVFLVVEYNDKVRRVHDERLGGVIDVNGVNGSKKYLIVGTLGYPAESAAKSDWNNIINKLNTAWVKGKAREGQRYYVDETMHTEAYNISSGWKVRKLVKDKDARTRKISELLEDPDRNPEGLKIEELKWGIQYDNGQFVTIKVNDLNKVYKPVDEKDGSVYLLVKTANGNYVPIYIY